MSASEELRKMVADLGQNATAFASLERELHRPLIPPMPLSQTNPAAWTRQRLLEYIKGFESKLDTEHEVGARLVSFGQSVTFHISNVGYYGPDVISFDGIDDQGQVVQLIQHISQLSVLLIALKKQAEKPRRIGFLLDDSPPSSGSAA